MKSTETLAQLKSATGFTPLGEAVGNLTLGRGRLGTGAGAGAGATPVHMAIVENRIASGSLGVKECEKLASLFRIVATQKSPLLIYLDSAGAKVSEGLPALGAFRQMYRAAVEMALSGAPVVALLGANCGCFRITRNWPCQAPPFSRRARAHRRSMRHSARLRQ
jgi:acetyl-CoA carboxylase carboxyltransferase component